jgi:hypothetical protein
MNTMTYSQLVYGSFPQYEHVEESKPNNAELPLEQFWGAMARRGPSARCGAILRDWHALQVRYTNA